MWIADEEIEMQGVQPKALRLGRIGAFLLLGIVLPSVLMFQAYQAMGRMSEISNDGNDIGSAIKALPASVQNLRSNNDYALISIAAMEASNQRAMQVKQRMKMSVMHIGFAVISLGLMLLLFGLEAGGVDLQAASQQAVTLNIKTTSTSVTVILLGASLAAAGALVPNAYSTVSIPQYAPISGAAVPETASLERLLGLAKQCLSESPMEQLAACYHNAIVSVTTEGR